MSLTAIAGTLHTGSNNNDETKGSFLLVAVLLPNYRVDEKKIVAYLHVSVVIVGPK